MIIIEIESEDVVLTRANIHHGDLKKDKRFDCKDNCPYCNNEMICIKLQYVLPVYTNIKRAHIYKSFKCQVCGKEFWEVWYACEHNYYIPDDEDYYYNQVGYYTDAYYDERQDAYCQSFGQALETGDWEIVASYLYTVITPHVDEKKYISELSHKRSHTIFRRLTPEIVDIFDMVEFGPIESRFEILD